MSHSEYFLRGPTRADLLSDLQSVLPDDTDYLWEETDENGDPTGRLMIDTSVAVLVPEGEWWIERPVYGTDADGNTIVEQEGTRADYAIMNLRTDDESLQSLVESFAPSDPSKEPSEVPSSEKIGAGTHRITEPSSPARTFQ